MNIKPDGAKADYVIDNVTSIRRNLLGSGWDLATAAMELATVTMSEEMIGKSPQEVADITKSLLIRFLRQHRDGLIDTAVRMFNTKDGLLMQSGEEA